MPDHYIPADNDEYIEAIGDTAKEIIMKRDLAVKHAGGVTPEQLQEYTGQFYGMLNPRFSNDSLGAILLGLAEESKQLFSGKSERAEMEIAGDLMLLAMCLGYEGCFGSFDAAYEALDLQLQDAITRARENKERLINKTEG